MAPRRTKKKSARASGTETVEAKKTDSKQELEEGDSTLDAIKNLDGNDSDKDTDDDVDDLELADAIVDYTQAAAASHDPASDSSEDEHPNKNTVGNIPYKEWYKDEEHVGYDVEGGKLIKSERRDALDRLLARNDSAKEWRTVYDEYNDEEIVLSKEEMRMIRRIREGKFAHVEIDPFEPENDWFTRDQEIMPLSGAPEPKRRFIVSKWEEKKIVKLVRAMRKGWLKRTGPEEKPAVYLMWEGDGLIDDASDDKTATGLTYIPAPKLKLPGHEESYNPPPEYVPTEEERNAALLQAEETGDPAPFLPKIFNALRKVPAYESFIQERFERCLDLYLCPRAKTRRLRVDDPEDLVPKLPNPKDLQPFPTILAHRFLGHTGAVRSVCPDGTGQWLATGSADGTTRVWEVVTGRCMKVWQFQDPVSCVSWCPDPKLELLAAAVGNKLVLLVPDIGSMSGHSHSSRGGSIGNNPRALAAKTALEAALVGFSNSNTQSGIEEKENKGSGTLVTWKRYREGSQNDDGSSLQGLILEHRFPVKHVSWHGRGDYFSTVAPTGNTKAVLVHQLSKGQSQNPFRKNRGRVVRTLFHPSKPFFFVATQQAVRVYNLAKQSLAKKLIGGSGVITSMAIHSNGDHLLVGAEDRRVCWYDLDLSSKPYKALKYHEHAVRGAAYHRSYPLFASSSDDGTVHIFHGMVYSDLMTNPLIVPVKILRGHKRVEAAGVLDVAFHPTQPWVFSAGADGTVCLYVNP
jgi:ribosome biogenesis protein ERB1